MAGLVCASAWVSVEPPLSASGPRRGQAVIVPESKVAVDDVMRLFAPLIEVVCNALRSLGAPDAELSAMIVLSRFSVVPAACRPPSMDAWLNAIVLLAIVAGPLKSMAPIRLFAPEAMLPEIVLLTISAVCVAPAAA